MAKVGRFVTDPRAGAYCQIVLDDSKKITVIHDRGGFKGGHITIEAPKWLGISSDQIFDCDLDSAAGKAALARLTQGVPPESARATPLGAFVDAIKDCKSIEEVTTRCAAVMSGH